MDPRGGWLPGHVLADGDGEREPAKRDARQVNVRLGWWQYDELRKAADIYGVTPTTMARMLIKRGSRSILVDYWKELRAHPGED